MIYFAIVCGNVSPRDEVRHFTNEHVCFAFWYRELKEGRISSFMVKKLDTEKASNAVLKMFRQMLAIETVYVAEEVGAFPSGRLRAREWWESFNLIYDAPIAELFAMQQRFVQPYAVSY